MKRTYLVCLFTAIILSITVRADITHVGDITVCENCKVTTGPSEKGMWNSSQYLVAYFWQTDDTTSYTWGFYLPVLIGEKQKYKEFRYVQSPTHRGSHNYHDIFIVSPKTNFTNHPIKKRNNDRKEDYIRM